VYQYCKCKILLVTSCELWARGQGGKGQGKGRWRACVGIWGPPRQITTSNRARKRLMAVTPRWVLALTPFLVSMQSDAEISRCLPLANNTPPPFLHNITAAQSQFASLETSLETRRTHSIGIVSSTICSRSGVNETRSVRTSEEKLPMLVRSYKGHARPHARFSNSYLESAAAVPTLFSRMAFHTNELTRGLPTSGHKDALSHRCLLEFGGVKDPSCFGRHDRKTTQSALTVWSPGCRYTTGSQLGNVSRNSTPLLLCCAYCFRTTKRGVWLVPTGRGIPLSRAMAFR